MIGFISGKVIFSDGNEIIIQCPSGIGYQIFFNKVLPESKMVSLFISHVIKEASQDLYAFHSLREKKLFEMLMSVKGVGPKSAYALTTHLGIDQICNAIAFDDKKMISKAPGIGPKAAAQVILDLSNKISKIKMYSHNKKVVIDNLDEIDITSSDLEGEQIGFNDLISETDNSLKIIDETLVACKELGFKESNIMPLISELMGKNEIIKSEQLVHLVLKNI